MTPRSTVLAGLSLSAALALGLSACGSDSSTTGPSAAPATVSDSGTTPAATTSPTTTVPATTDGGSGSGDCAKYSPGKDGVIQTFCDGSATAAFTVGGKTTVLSGGECDETGGYFAINIGVVAGPDFSGAKPDYLGALLPDKEGAFTATAIAGAIDGAGFAFQSDGSVDPGFKGASFSGTDKIGTAGKIDVKVTC